MLVALAVHLSASASRVSRLSATTLISGRLLHKHMLLPTDGGLYSEGVSSLPKQTVRKETLGPLLAQPLLEIVADYSGSRSWHFAEALYAELWAGKTDLLRRELCSGGVLRERHHFWDYLSGGAERVVALVHMLWAAQREASALGDKVEELCSVGRGNGAADGILCSVLSRWQHAVCTWEHQPGRVATGAAGGSPAAVGDGREWISFGGSTALPPAAEQCGACHTLDLCTVPFQGLLACCGDKGIKD